MHAGFFVASLFVCVQHYFSVELCKKFGELLGFPPFLSFIPPPLCPVFRFVFENLFLQAAVSVCAWGSE